jgi:methionyl-tRNA formyltransferase
MNNKIYFRKSVLFFGSGSLAAETLKRLAIEDDIHILAIYPRMSHSSEVPENSDELISVANSLNIDIVLANNINSAENIEIVSQFKPDLIINWGFNQIFSQKLLNCAHIGGINFHPGLIPNGRGCNPIEGEVWNCQGEIGQVVHFMNDEIDKGKVVHSRAFKIRGDEYESELLSKLNFGVVDFFLEGINKVIRGERGVNVDGFGRYYPCFIDGDDIIDWNMPSDHLMRRIRSRAPTILSRCFRARDKMEIYISKVSLSVVESYYSPAGQIIDKSPTKGVLVKTGDSALWVEEISLDKINFRVPSFPIGTAFMVASLHELLNLDRQIDKLRDEIKSLRSIILNM